MTIPLLFMIKMLLEPIKTLVFLRTKTWSKDISLKFYGNTGHFKFNR